MSKKWWKLAVFPVFIALFLSNPAEALAKETVHWKTEETQWIKANGWKTLNFDGKTSNAYAISKVGYGIDEQLMQELQKLVFKPATQGSIPYRSEVVLEIPVKAVYLKD